jgi:hypothetical protein
MTAVLLDAQLDLKPRKMFQRTITVTPEKRLVQVMRLGREQKSDPRSHTKSLEPKLVVRDVSCDFVDRIAAVTS